MKAFTVLTVAVRVVSATLTTSPDTTPTAVTLEKRIKTVTFIPFSSHESMPVFEPPQGAATVTIFKTVTAPKTTDTREVMSLFRPPETLPTLTTWKTITESVFMPRGVVPVTVLKTVTHPRPKLTRHEAMPVFEPQKYGLTVTVEGTVVNEIYVPPNVRPTVTVYSTVYAGRIRRGPGSTTAPATVPSSTSTSDAPASTGLDSPAENPDPIPDPDSNFPHWNTSDINALTLPHLCTVSDATKSACKALKSTVSTCSNKNADSTKCTQDMAKAILYKVLDAGICKQGLVDGQGADDGLAEALCRRFWEEASRCRRKRKGQCGVHHVIYLLEKLGRLLGVLGG
ncbi:hypothetical protein BCR34DRAFT_669766 [Clohesyomyces aquaticus]|uniref:Extracellular membrane protein CFEM domain-containing protein n=1 Tax=Clohesyomyces aquaticus TaxID=1231657 RepID=A0A1Y1Y7J0_9PLEO|nr:hypothetical protein BCR34DRAFT_669766 [Clohesyomyces aquaticus]